MRNALIYFFIINFLLIFNGGFSAPSKYEGMIIRKNEFVGLKNIDDDDLRIELESTDIETGFPLKASEIRKAVKIIFEKGQF
jgi:outer membrane protein assembly factor BamA